MKTILAFVIGVIGLSAHAGILAGPIVNPSNGHTYYLLSKNTLSNAEAEAVSLGGHLVTIRNAGEQEWVFSVADSFAVIADKRCSRAYLDFWLSFCSFQG